MTREVESASGLPGQDCCTVCAAADWAASKNAAKADFSTDIGLIWRGTLLQFEISDYLPRRNAEATSIVGKVQGCVPP
jgi:hypothetical protein